MEKGGSLRPHVYVLYTGGTIGCAGSPLAPLTSNDFAKLVASQPGFSQNSEKGRSSSSSSSSKSQLVLNVNVNDEEEATIDVTMDDIKPAIDSSSMTPGDWITIATRILQNYCQYKGIVVLHGTDTMAFTSTAVSYLMGQGVSKPIIFTGSQVPLSKTRNDALRNLISSITLAATHELYEVGLFFDNKLLRGNRAVKVSASAFPAFYSPNDPPIGTVGIEINMRTATLMEAPSPEHSLEAEGRVEALLDELSTLRSAFDTFSVITIVLHPGIRASTVKGMIESTTPPVRGIVIQAFGAGNAPADDDLIRTLAQVHGKGVVLCDITQIVSGGVDLDAYESASGLRHAGCISGYDMTEEAALAKLVYLIGKGYDQKKVEELMMEPMQQDLTHEVKMRSDSHWEALIRKRGKAAIVRRLLKKREASQMD